MAFSTGDLVPYNQLPGAVAGQEAAQIPQSYVKGQMDRATLESSLAKAKQDQIAASMTTDRLPQELLMKNIQDLQSVNTLPPKPTLDNVNDAEQDVLGDDVGKREPTAMERHKIQIRSEELAREQATKPDPMNPMPYLEQVNPSSNRQMQLEGQQALYNGRMGIAELNNQGKNEREDKALDFKKSDRQISEAGKNFRTGAGGAGANLKGQKAADEILKNFKSNSMYGRVPPGSEMGDTYLNKPEAKTELMNTYQELLGTDKPSAQRFYNSYGKYLGGVGAPANNTVTPGPNGTQVVKGAAPDPNAPKTVSIGHQVYTVGQTVRLKKDNVWHSYQVTPEGGLKILGD